MTLLNLIAEHMRTDTENPEEQSNQLLDVWERADEATRAALDDAFTALCGYSLTTLIPQSGASVNVT